MTMEDDDVSYLEVKKEDMVPIPPQEKVWAQTDDGIRGFVVPTATPGFSAHEIHKKMSLRASVTAELVFDNMRLPASAMLPGVRGIKGPLACLNEARFGIAFGTMGAARDCLETALSYSIDREQFDPLRYCVHNLHDLIRPLSAGACHHVTDTGRRVRRRSS